MPISGAWLARTPMEPVVVRDESISTSSENTWPSGVRTSTWNLFLATVLPVLRALLLCPLALFLFFFCCLAAPGGLEDVVDRPLQQEGALRQVVVLALDDLLERAHRVLDRDVGARGARELLGHEERLREEALDLSGPLHGELVLVRELVDSEDGDDVLELLVALEDLPHLVGHLEVLLADDVRLEDGRGGIERVDGRVDALLRDLPRQRSGGVEVGEHRGRRGIGEVVRRYINRLDRSHRALARRGDPLLELAHLGLQGGLVAD